MAYEQKPGQGSMFRADKKGVENRPDYEGTANIDGTTYRIAGWIKEGAKGKWLSLKIEVPRPAAPKPADDDPFR